MLNKKFIQEKIELIQQDLVYMEKLSRFSFQEIVSDFTRMNAFERLLEKAVVRAIDINEHFINELATAEKKSPQNYKETFLRLAEFGVYSQEFAENIAKSVGTRNALTHDYDELDLQKIYSSIKECLGDYYKYCEYILQFLEK
ncbi:MAG: HepT-like ribonuclease domain-containing protein [Patescibacteria group bacterium]